MIMEYSRNWTHFPCVACLSDCESTSSLTNRSTQSIPDPTTPIMSSSAIVLVLSLTIIALSNVAAFLPHRLTRRSQTHTLLQMVKIGPRKQLFFEIVESGLNDRFPENNDIARVFKFCQYAKSDIPKPNPLGAFHDPCEEFVENLTALPWWDPSKFSWVAGLEAQSKVIAEELKSVLSQQEAFKGDSRYQNTMGDGWTAFRLQRLGEWNEENVKVFPKTSEIIRSLDIPLAVRGVMFAKQLPGTGVQPHSDGRNFILTAHLGISVPKQGCWISVAGEKKSWEQDKTIIFDTSFIHSTGNESDEDRYVLIIDFWHPELTEEEQEALEFVYDARNKFETGKAAEIDCTYVNTGNPIDVDAYVKSKETFVTKIGSFFSDGGFIKYNPLK